MLVRFCKDRGFLFILFAVFGTGALASTSEFFPSPERVGCLSPFMVEIHNEEEPIDFRKGIYGEECIEKTLKKYARFKGGRVTVFNIKDRGDQGVDYFLVDEDASLVIFLEAKGRAFESLFDAKMERDLQPYILRDDKNYNRDAIERIQYRLKTLLKKTPMDQLSRGWCERWCNEVLGSGDRSEEAKSLRAAMDAGYGFMRLASLTTGLNDAHRSITYYALVRDGDSETKASDDPSRRQRFVDKGLDHVLERKEWGVGESMTYLSAAYVLLENKEMPVRWLTPSASPQKPAKDESKKRLRDEAPEESRAAAAAPPPPPPPVYTADFKRKVAIAAMNKGSRSINDICREFDGVSKTSVYAWMREFKEGNLGEGTATSAGPSAPPPPLPAAAVEVDEEVIDIEEDDEPAAAAPARRVGPYPLEFKQRVALEAEIEGKKRVEDRKTQKEIAAKYGVREGNVSEWKRQFGPDGILDDLLGFNFKASELDALIKRIERAPLIAEATVSERFCDENGLTRCYEVFKWFNQCTREAYGPMKQEFLDELKKRKIEREKRQKKAETAAAVSEDEDSDASSSDEDEASPKHEHRKKYSDKEPRHKKHKHKKHDY